MQTSVTKKDQTILANAVRWDLQKLIDETNSAAISGNFIKAFLNKLLVYLSSLKKISKIDHKNILML